MVTLHPEDSGQALLNPGMGWNFPYFTDNGDNHYGGQLAPDDQLEWFPGCNSVSFRIGWQRVEPEEGRFNWDYTDAIAERSIAKGRQVSFCWICQSTIGSQPATPTWVRDAGAKGWVFQKRSPGEITCWVPDWEDPVFLAKLENFARAAAERYDGRPPVAFVEIGSLGCWGEGHNHGSPTPIAESAKRAHIDLWRRHFTRTPLIVNDDYLDDAVRYAQQRGCGLADWSIMVEGGDRAYFHQNFADWFWRDRPVVLENEHYHGAAQKGTWGDGSKYLAAVEDYHASWARIHGWPREFLEGDAEKGLMGNRELVAAINRRIGYRIQLLRAAWKPRVQAGQPALFHLCWRNGGVAPCYGGGRPSVSLRDKHGRIVAEGVSDSFNVRSLEVGRPAEDAPPQDVSVAVSLPARLAGEYQVCVSVRTDTGCPAAYALPLPGDCADRRYPLGVVEVG